MAGMEAYLEGDWTFIGAAHKIDSLSLSLQQIESRTNKNLSIDCGRVVKADVGGLQLLNVWMECVRMRGVVPTLVNVPNTLKHAMLLLAGHS